MKTLYDDIIRLPHHVSRNHPQMSLGDRAAQFAPFAAARSPVMEDGTAIPPDGIIIWSSSMKTALSCHKRHVRCLTDLDPEPEKNILWASQLRLLPSEAFF